MRTDGIECHNLDCPYRDYLYEFSCSKGEWPQPEDCSDYISAHKLQMHEHPGEGK